MLVLNPGTWWWYLNSFIFSLKWLISNVSRWTLILRINMKSCMVMELSNWLRVNDQWWCRNKMAKQFLNWNEWIIEFEVWVTYLFKLKSKFLLKCFQLLFDDCYSTTGPYGRCLNAMLALKWSGTLYPSPTVATWCEFRIWGWRCYRSGMMIWITHMKYMEGFWSVKS